MKAKKMNENFHEKFAKIDFCSRQLKATTTHVIVVTRNTTSQQQHKHQSFKHF